MKQYKNRDKTCQNFDMKDPIMQLSYPFLSMYLLVIYTQFQAYLPFCGIQDVTESYWTPLYFTKLSPSLVIYPCTDFTSPEKSWFLLVSVHSMIVLIFLFCLHDKEDLCAFTSFWTQLAVIFIFSFQFFKHVPVQMFDIKDMAITQQSYFFPIPSTCHV